MLVSAKLVRLTKGDDLAPSAISGPANGPEISIKKFDKDEQVVFGEVYAPGFPDSQGDYMSADEIKKMAYNFMQKGLVGNIDHDHSQVPNGSYVAESFIARDDDPTFIPGSWVLGVKIPDEAVWHRVKSGDLNGFSLDGFGVRTDKPFVVEMPELLKGETDSVEDHTHSFVVKFDRKGNFMGGMTNPAEDGHVHRILRGTVTEPAQGHVHRFSFIEGVLGNGTH